MFNGSSIIDTSFVIITALGLALAFLCACAIITRETTRVGPYTPYHRLREYGALTYADDPQAPGVAELTATWERLTKRPAPGLWGLALALALYLLAITGIAVVARLSFNSLLAGLLPCAWLGWLIGDQTAYLRELARLPRDPDDPTRAPATTRYQHRPGAWAYWLTPAVLFLYIAALAIYVAWASPSSSLTWDAAEAQAHRIHRPCSRRTGRRNERQRMLWRVVARHRAAPIPARQRPVATSRGCIPALRRQSTALDAAGHPDIWLERAQRAGRHEYAAHTGATPASQPVAVAQRNTSPGVGGVIWTLDRKQSAYVGS